MKNFVLGVLVALACSSWALTKNEDGSVLLTRDEVNDINVRWYQLDSNFNLAIDKVRELSDELDKLRKSKCI